MNDTKENLLNDPFMFQKIQERAYFIAESNGFAPGRDADNWFAAEAEILTPILTNENTNGTVKTVKTATRKTAPKKAVTTIVETTAAPAPRARRASRKSA
ncbi:MAG TPA: DUF2934 domain-containing protein [Abditibacteriaceae bacterium]